MRVSSCLSWLIRVCAWWVLGLYLSRKRIIVRSSFGKSTAGSLLHSSQSTSNSFINHLRSGYCAIQRCVHAKRLNLPSRERHPQWSPHQLPSSGDRSAISTRPSWVEHPRPIRTLAPIVRPTLPIGPSSRSPDNARSGESRGSANRALEPKKREVSGGYAVAKPGDAWIHPA